MGMMLPLLLAAAVHGAGPRPIDPKVLAGIGNLDNNTLPSNHEGVAFVTLSIDPFGTPFRCDVLKSSGFRGMDARTCAALLTRARFVPARDEADVPVTSVFQTAVRWGTGVAGSPGYLVDMTVMVGKLPGNVERPVTSVRQIIAADGSLESCAVERGSGVDALDRVACRQAEGLAKLGPARDRAGAPVRTLRVSRLVFVEADG